MKARNVRRSAVRRQVEAGFCPACGHRLQAHDMFRGCEVGGGHETQCWCPLTEAIDRREPQIIEALLDAARKVSGES